VSEPVFTFTKRRRTPALTDAARDLFESMILSEGWTPGHTIPKIAVEVGLSPEQVRDAIFAPSADPWRANLTERINTRT
jgi:hypothetical protein